jgi:glycosyltransferase involved in cell wall biosynthesis
MSAPSVFRRRANLLTVIADRLMLARMATRRTPGSVFYTVDAVESAALVLCGVGRKTVWHGHSNVLHHSQFRRPWDAQTYRLLLWSSQYAGPRLARTVVLGPSLARWWMKFGVPADRIVVVPNAIDPPEPCGARIGDKRRPPGLEKLLYVGRLSPEKGGIDDLLRAIGLLAEQGIGLTLDIVGEGSLRTELEDLARSTGITDRVTFHGAVDHAATSRFYCQTDLVILPSRGEMMPRVMLEAWSYGVPFMVTPVGAIPDYLHDGVNGFLLTDPSPGGIAARLAEVMLDPDLLTSVGQQGRETAAQLSWRKAVESLVRLALEPVDGENRWPTVKPPQARRNGNLITRLLSGRQVPAADRLNMIGMAHYGVGGPADD